VTIGALAAMTITPVSADTDAQAPSIDALASLVPAIIGAAVGPADSADPSAGQIASPAQQSILTQARQLAATQGLPPELKSMLTAVVGFLDGSSGGGPKLPGRGPVIAQFLYPSIGKACIGDTADSVATALAVPGPATIPLPGPKPGQAAFVFTALGTKPPTPQQPDPLTVTWLNLDNRRTATQPLTDAAHINPAGPATLSTIADTGPGRVVAVISGGLVTAADPAHTRSCTFLPTVGMFTVGS
jgi:hypothetical protein